MSFDYWKWHRSLALLANGFLIPLLLTGWGLHSLWYGEASFPASGRSGGGELHLPPDAVPPFAAACIALGLFFHVHFFWIGNRGAGRFGRLTERLLAAVFLPCLAWAFFRAIAPY